MAEIKTLKYPISIIYPMDPLGKKVGGAENFLKGFIKNAPPDIDIEFIGVTTQPVMRHPKKWSKLCLGNKNFDFYPLFYEKKEDRKTLIPLSLRFTLALKFSLLNLEKKLLFFNRIEPAILFKKNKSPKIAVVHNDILNQIFAKGSEVLWNKFPAIYQLLERYIFSYMDYVYTVSENTLRFYLKSYAKQKDKFAFLPMGVDTDIFYPLDEPKYNLRKELVSLYLSLPREDSKWILFVGRLQEQKAPLRVVETFREYNQKNKASCLIMIGEGNLRNAVKRYITILGLEKKVFLLGNLISEKLADFYRACDILLLTSNFEGMPLCVLEALACGLPVVSTDVGEVNRVVKNNFSGEVVKDFLPQGLASTLQRVLDNPHIYTKSNCLNCITRYTAQKTLEPVYELIIKLYKEKYDAHP